MQNTATIIELSQKVSRDTKRPFYEVHTDAVSVAKDIKNNYLKMFEILLEVEAGRIYEQYEVASFHLYCIELLELSPQLTKDFRTVVRKSIDVPQLAEAIRSKRVTISKARKICPVVTSDDYDQWINLAAECSCRVVEKTVAMANPRSAISESMKYVSADVLEYKLAVSEEWAEMLKRTKDLLSQKLKRAVSSEEALMILMKENIRKNDPVLKSERAMAKSKFKQIAGNNNSEIIKSETAHKTRSRYRPADIEHLVDLRDQGQCSYIDKNGKRCESKRWLEKHHIAKFANGGKHTVENIRTFCSAHHKIIHMTNS